MPFLLRLISYCLTWVTYLIFMTSYAPLGTGWLPWHFQRIFNAVDFLKINGYLSSYGFTVWTKCQDCSLDLVDWVEKTEYLCPLWQHLN